MTKSWFAPQDPPVRTEVSGKVWKSVLVPLDGREPSGRAVARAGHLLERPGVAVTLLRVIECGEDRANDLGYQMDSRHRRACDALAEVRAGFADRSREVNADVRFGDPATEILREIAEGNHDLVLMSTNGRAGLGRAFIGSVARRVLLSSPIPLLLFRPRMEPDGTLSRSEASDVTRFRSLLVALDGSKTAEEILPLAEKMARTLGSELHLFRPVSSGSKEAAEWVAAEEYLWKWKDSLASRGMPSQVHVRAGNAAEAALALIRERGLDSIALSTHARAGLARAAYGSVTQELLGGADVPILTLCNRRRRLAMPAPAREHRHVRVG
jgi:nucleotide-binding universal stress UspA family protein